jgi:hypothetical protein
LKTFFVSLVILLFGVHLCHQNVYSMGAWPWKKKTPTVEVPPPVELPPIEVTAPKDGVRIVLKSLTGFSPAQAARFERIALQTEKVINSPEFKAAVLGWYHKGKRQFFDTEDSNEKVLENILSADWSLEYRLEFMRPFSSVIGYTYPDVTWIVLNARKYGVLGDGAIAGNICHEAGAHKLGRYVHSYNATPDRPYSVPYGLGWICEDLYGKIE